MTNKLNNNNNNNSLFYLIIIIFIILILIFLFNKDNQKCNLCNNFSNLKKNNKTVKFKNINKVKYFDNTESTSDIENIIEKNENMKL